MLLRKAPFLFILFAILLSAGCGATPATVSEISVSPSTNIESGTQIALYVTAVGAGLTYRWSATDGTFVGSNVNPAVIYVAPKTAGVVTITVEVKDASQISITKNITLTIQSPPTPTATITPSPEPTNTPEPTSTATPTPVSFYVIFGDSGKLAAGLDMGVNTSGGATGWVDSGHGEMCMAYPGGQWGSVFITVGKPIPPGNRPGKDFSAYKTLSLDLKGAKGNEYVLVGLKDTKDADDGTEATVPLTLTTDYKTYAISLGEFTTADLSNLYVVAEFVFEKTPEKICVNNIRFLP